MPLPPLKTEPRRHMAGMAACSRVRTAAAHLRTTQTRWTRFCTLKPRLGFCCHARTPQQWLSADY